MSTSETVIETRLGKVRGLDNGNARSFLGLRYGEPPTGSRRFLPPTLASAWRGTLDATRHPNRAMQATSDGQERWPAPGDVNEDCLFLNIATPSASGERRPVLFWIHGGAFILGSANEYDGTVLAGQGDVVVVIANFRVGTFGFLDLSAHGSEFRGSASNGVLDLILALQWVRENIESFGGDPHNVTIFGESSGGSIVHGLLGAPAADKLYHKAIAHSATCAFRPSSDRTDTIAAQIGVDRGNFVETLLSMPAQDIVDLDLRYGITVDGTVITRTTLDAISERGDSGVPLITGTNLREGTLYTNSSAVAQPHYPAMNEMLATEVLLGRDPKAYLAALHATYPDASAGRIHEMIWTDMFRSICTQTAAASSLAGPGGWLYRFDLPANLPEFKHLGATHSSELAFTFNAFANPDTHTRVLHDRGDPVVRKIARGWSDCIIHFARHGVPGGVEFPEWPRYDADERQCLVINDDFGVVADPDRVHRNLWNQQEAQC